MSADAAMPRLEKAVDALVAKFSAADEAQGSNMEQKSDTSSDSDDSSSSEEGEGDEDEDEDEDEDADELRARAAKDPRLARILARAEAAEDDSDDEGRGSEDGRRQKKMKKMN